jgi:hypothetical protein
VCDVDPANRALTEASTPARLGKRADDLFDVVSRLSTGNRRETCQSLCALVDPS